MDNRQQRTLRAFENVLIYCEQHPVNPEPPLLAGMRKSLRASIARIERLGSDQWDATRAMNGGVPLRVRLLRRDKMMPLVRIAKPLLAFAPGVERALRVPHARSDALTVATAALKMADAIAPHTKLLASAGYSKDFVRDFRAEARALALVARNADKARANRSKATQAIAAEIKKAMQTVMVLEGLVMLHIGSNKSSVGLWKNRRRVSARIGRPKQRRKTLLATSDGPAPNQSMMQGGAS